MRVMTMRELHLHERDLRVLEASRVAVAVEALRLAAQMDGWPRDQQGRLQCPVALDLAMRPLQNAVEAYRRTEAAHRATWDPIFAECGDDAGVYCRGCGGFLPSLDLGPYCHRCPVRGASGDAGGSGIDSIAFDERRAYGGDK